MLKKNYDGYRFSESGSDIYNPWSILNAMSESQISNYWNQTGKPTIIAEALKHADVDLEKILNSRCTLDQLGGLDLTNASPLALLYQTGYLTIKNFNPTSNRVTLTVPNKEVREGLFNELFPYYINVNRGTPSLLMNDIINNLLDGEPKELFENLNIFFAGIPYDMKMESENNIHNAIYILLTLIGVNVETEVHTSDGRIDLLIKTPDYRYIIEIKFDKDAITASEQIEEKAYELPFKKDGRHIFKIGVNFSPVTRRLDPPVITEL